ncbi:MAG: DEAD/DEAH box helicase [bacterium]|nr:DEAD/DEAH box helicase [bacterium]
MNTFDGLGIAPNLLTELTKLGFKEPTPIQHQAIPPALEGKDVIGVAQTGTGKTLAFGLPLIQRLASGHKYGLVLVPTRELALQIEVELRKISSHQPLRTAILIGGSPMGAQLRALKAGPQVVIATPGRLNDHWLKKTINLTGVGILVIDEADRMLDMGFWPQIKRLIAGIPADHQTLLFSATLSKEILALASKHMKLPTSIEVAPSGTTVDKVSQEFLMVRKEDKMHLLKKVLGEYRGSTIVFTRTKHGASRVMRGVKTLGHTAAEIHSNRSLGQRKEALEGFKAGRYRVLVATDIAARGIDVKGIELVINYDLPGQSEDYVHRIGRTARAGAAGHAISFATPDQRREIKDIERLIRKPIPVSNPAGFAHIATEPPPQYKPSSHYRSRFRR